jgi:hypothetical protein
MNSPVAPPSPTYSAKSPSYLADQRTDALREDGELTEDEAIADKHIDEPLDAGEQTEEDYSSSDEAFELNVPAIYATPARLFEVAYSGDGH